MSAARKFLSKSRGITRSLKNGGSVIGKNSAIGSLLSGGWSRSKTGPSLAKNPLISKG